MIPSPPDPPAGTRTVGQHGAPCLRGVRAAAVEAFAKRADLPEETDVPWTSLGPLSDSARQQHADRDTHGEHEERDAVEERDRAVSQGGLSRGPGE